MFTFNRRIVKAAFALFLGAALAGCSTYGNSTLKNETQASVSQKIQKGVTTKEQVRSLYGDPSKVTFTDSGNEVWTYSMYQNNFSFLSILPVPGTSTLASTQDHDSHLVVMFDKAGRVSNYSFANAKTGANL